MHGWLVPAWGERSKRDKVATEANEHRSRTLELHWPQLVPSSGGNGLRWKEKGLAVGESCKPNVDIFVLPPRHTGIHCLTVSRWQGWSRISGLDKKDGRNAKGKRKGGGTVGRGVDRLMDGAAADGYWAGTKKQSRWHIKSQTLIQEWRSGADVQPKHFMSRAHKHIINVRHAAGGGAD